MATVRRLAHRLAQATERRDRLQQALDDARRRVADLKAALAEAEACEAESRHARLRIHKPR